MPDPTTTAIDITFDLNTTSNVPPFNVSGCTADITTDGVSIPTPGWGQEHIRKLAANGAEFSVKVRDGASAPATGIGYWALTYIRRTDASDASPFANNKSIIQGRGGVLADGCFTLDLAEGQGNGRSIKIKNAGDWDWSLMVQMICPGSVIKCFGSDPEMKVDA